MQQVYQVCGMHMHGQASGAQMSAKACMLVRKLIGTRVYVMAVCMYALLTTQADKHTETHTHTHLEMECPIWVLEASCQSRVTITHHVVHLLLVPMGV